MGAVLIERYNIMGIRNALFTKEMCTKTIIEIGAELIQIA
jgi:hypothetical protein